MRRLALCAALFWAASLGAILSRAEVRPVTSINAGAIFGADAGWCREAGACNAFNASCNSNASCMNSGDACGVTRIAKSPESCDTTYGNQYCNTGEPVEVICAVEWVCNCLAIVPPEGGGSQLGCVGGNSGGGPGTDVAGSITTDPLTCAYEAKP